MLLNQGKSLADFENLEANIKSAISPEANAFLRILNILGELSKTDDAPDTSTKEGLKELVLRHIQASKLDIDEVKTLPGFQNAEAVLGNLKSTLGKTWSDLRQKLEAQKIALKPIFDDYLQWSSSLAKPGTAEGGRREGGGREGGREGGRREGRLFYQA